MTASLAGIFKYKVANHKPITTPGAVVVSQSSLRPLAITSGFDRIQEETKETGGAEGVRTPDLLNAIQALYQLSYDPNRSGKNVRRWPKLSKRISGAERRKNAFEVWRTNLYFSLWMRICPVSLC